VIAIAIRPRSIVLLPASFIAREGMERSRVLVGASGAGAYDSSTSSSSTSSMSTEETTTNESGNAGLISKLPLYALYIVIAGVIYYVGYKLISAAWASKAGHQVHHAVR